jgi:hypothetical protein
VDEVVGGRWQLLIVCVCVLHLLIFLKINNVFWMLGEELLSVVVGQCIDLGHLVWWSFACDQQLLDTFLILNRPRRCVRAISGRAKIRVMFHVSRHISYMYLPEHNECNNNNKKHTGPSPPRPATGRPCGRSWVTTNNTRHYRCNTTAKKTTTPQDQPATFAKEIGKKSKHLVDKI